MKAVISKQLQDTLHENPGVKEVHFTGDGHYHFRTFKFGGDGKLYTRLDSVPEKTGAGVFTGKMTLAVLKDKNNQPDAQYIVVETLTREQVLSATSVGDKGPAVFSSDLASAVESMSTEELQAILKARKKK